jgi:hypothetical protein
VFDSHSMANASHTGAKRAAAAVAAKTAHGLHVCPHCDSRLVQPTCWEQADRRGRWRVWRRCPECEWRCSSVHGEREVDAYDMELDNGTVKLAGELEDMERESMRQLAVSFAVALQTDLIDADDFR